MCVGCFLLFSVSLYFKERPNNGGAMSVGSFQGGNKWDIQATDFDLEMPYVYMYK